MNLPAAAFPTALNECFDVYKWVAAGKLGFRPSKCVQFRVLHPQAAPHACCCVCVARRLLLAGDSVGGNLAAAMCLKTIMEKERIPDGCELNICPFGIP